ncbi:NUDIX domain-containing protein [Nocardia suismassiliense]|uniref:NUDIX domain-containing protein n=1 Tax=Nocardia suismassiliense TaxID=2077092 RepID=UPI000D1FAF2E|nr:NUDIX hydrolase [Nocardia suismassiliense]
MSPNAFHSDGAATTADRDLRADTASSRAPGALATAADSASASAPQCCAEHSTADVVALTHHDDQWHVLLIERVKPPFQGRWALPGGRAEPGEAPAVTALRELREETGVHVGGDQLRLVGEYDAAGRDPRGDYVSTAYLAVLGHMPSPTAGDDARLARWHAVSHIVDQLDHLAFDHAQILAHALRLLRLEY